MKVLVTGGTGFIGSHTCVELLNAGYDVVIADNLYNSKALVVDRIEKITGRRPAFYELDVNDRAALTDLFDKEDIRHGLRRPCPDPDHGRMSHGRDDQPLRRHQGHAGAHPD